MDRTRKLLIVIALLLVVVVLAGCVHKSKQSGKEAITVYVTRTGECYHVDGCTSLSKSRAPIQLKEAKAKGYRECRRCGGG